jgi:transposase
MTAFSPASLDTLKMAPNLAVSQHDLIRDMLLDGSLSQVDMAKVAGCSDRTIRNIAANLRMFGRTKAPANGAGRRRRITPPMLAALCDRLIEKPGLYRDEMAVFLYDEFQVLVSLSSISRALASIKWTKKVTQRIANERNTDLRDFYLHKLSAFRSHQLVYVDESGCDKRIGFRRTGWSPLGVAPVEVTRLHRGRRYQILPAYTQDGVLFSKVFQGSTDGEVFEDFIEQLLHHCSPDAVLIMDNASFHHSECIKEMCLRAGVELLYLPPYSPDLNPIEEFFAELKAFIKKQWHEYESSPHQEFGAYLEWCIDVVGERQDSARGHFRHAGVTVEAC